MTDDNHLELDPWERPGGSGYGYGNIPEEQKERFDQSKLTDRFTIEEIRKMPIWAATIWNGYYVLYIATDGGTTIDEDGILPEGMECLFVNKKNGSIRIARSARAAHYFIDELRRTMPTQAMRETPFDNLKIG